MLLRREPDDLSELVAVKIDVSKQHSQPEEKKGSAPNLRYLTNIGSEPITVEGSLGLARQMAEHQALVFGQKLGADYVLISSNAQYIGSDGTRGVISTFIASYYQKQHFDDPGIG